MGIKINIKTSETSFISLSLKSIVRDEKDSKQNIRQKIGRIEKETFYL